MGIVKSYAIGNGDMYYIRHGSDNFTIVDCSLPSDRAGSILSELKVQSSDKGIVRFISTHPDQDHLSGLTLLDDELSILNFYVVRNSATKDPETADFKRYRDLRDSSKAFHLYRGCKRRWMNDSDDVRQTAGLEILWPVVDDVDYKAALAAAALGTSPNNISCILRYSIQEGPSFVWMGDLETDFMERVQDRVDLPSTDVLFAPHHGRDSGKVPPKWLRDMEPGLIVIGEAPSQYINYYSGYNVITQNSCGDILFESGSGSAHIYVGDHSYSTGSDFLEDEGLDHKQGLYYLGTLRC